MSLVYVGTIERENTITVDGYSSAKTKKGAINDFGRLIAKKFSKLEGEALIVKTNDEADDLISIGNENGEEFGIEVEPVEAATTINEDTDEVEYKEGYNFYVMVRFLK